MTAKKDYKFINLLKKHRTLFIFCVLTLFINILTIKAETISIKAKKTLTVVELNAGDIIEYELQSGRIVNLKLIESNSEVIFSTVELPGQGNDDDASVFKMECVINIDGQDLEMKRYVPVQESFYEPYNVNGLRIWFDAVKSVDRLYNENHGDCLPKKEVRLALHDASLPISPEEITTWCNLPYNYPDVKHSYRGEDTWLGTYYGSDLHGGLDINMPSNSPLWAPLSFDNNFTFNSIKSGHNNNRWRALKHWDNGDIWIVQTHHHNELIVPEFKEIRKGTKYAHSAGTLAGSHTHTHFVFKVKQPNFEEFYMDPWIIHWQILENKKEKSNALKAEIKSLNPGVTGETIQFDGTTSKVGLNTLTPDFYWSFGDGGSSIAQKPMHIYQDPGIYPVTLTLFDGVNYSTITQHIVINGESTKFPEFKVTQENNRSFAVRRAWEMDSYNNSEIMLPNTVSFTLPHYHKKETEAQEISINFINSAGFSGSRYPYRLEVNYIHGYNWLDFEVKNISNNSMNIKLIPKIENLNTQEGKSEAYLVIHDNGFINSPSLVKVEVDFSRTVNKSSIIIDDQDVNCIKSNYFWLTNKLNPELGLGWSKCIGESFLMSSGNSESDFIRYLPKVSEGKYRVSLYSPLYDQDVITKKIEGFNVIINSKNGIQKKWVKPNDTKIIGEFDFNSGDGYIEIISKGAKGLIIADAILLEKVE